MKLAPELVEALNKRAVFYGVARRLRTDPGVNRRSFGLNGLWFEVQVEEFEVTHKALGDNPPMTSTLKRIAEITFLPFEELGHVKLPRPAIVEAFTVPGAGFELHDVVVEHRHLRFSNGGREGRMDFANTPLDDGKPWRRPGTTDSIAIQEYVHDVRRARQEIEDGFADRITDFMMRRALEEADRREAAAAKLLSDNEANPVWGMF